jgi:nucleoside-diphosphate-sugar epimerase
MQARLRIAVTGATGFVGRRLCHRIADEGGEVTALVRRTSDRRPVTRAGVRFVTGDLVTGEGLAELTQDADWVLHLGGVVKALSTEGFHCNEAGARRLGEVMAARSDPPVFVLCSSLAAAGPSRIGRPRLEAEPAAPVSRYGRSKLAGEHAARATADRVPTTIVRPPVVYGPGDPAFVPSLLPMVRAGLVLKGGLGRREYSLVHVDDLCSALLAAARQGRRLTHEDPAAGVYSVSDGAAHTWESVCGELATVLGRRDPFVLPVPLPVVQGAAALAEVFGRVRGAPTAFNRDKAVDLMGGSWTCSTERARTELGFVPTMTLGKGLADLLAR